MSTKDLKVDFSASGSTAGERLPWLDGVRALAALFVVLHHTWLMTVGGYPGNNGPWFTDWMVYGHLAVSVFIVVSGYSLALAPVRHDFRFRDGASGFLRRRFWRIVPPYWAALILVTILIAAGITDPANGTDFSQKDFLVHFFLVQDTVENVSPNGAFWSIAVEWHIYFLYPLILLICRRWGILTAFSAVLLLVVSQHIIGTWVPVVALFNRFTPVYLMLFVCGLSAALLVQRRLASRTCGAAAALMFSGFIVYASSGGTEATVESYFWVDFTVGCATAALFVAFDQARLRWIVRALSWQPLTVVGSFAFSLYLIHAPVLAMLTTFVIKPMNLDNLLSLFSLLTLGVPASVLGAYLFFRVFEKPFLVIRSFNQLTTAISGGVSVARRLCREQFALRMSRMKRLTR